MPLLPHETASGFFKGKPTTVVDGKVAGMPLGMRGYARDCGILA